MERKFQAVIERDDDGRFVAYVPALPGCATEGLTVAEAMENMQEAIAGYLEVEDGVVVPLVFVDLHAVPQ